MRPRSDRSDWFKNAGAERARNGCLVNKNGLYRGMPPTESERAGSSLCPTTKGMMMKGTSSRRAESLHLVKRRKHTRSQGIWWRVLLQWCIVVMLMFRTTWVVVSFEMLSSLAQLRLMAARYVSIAMDTSVELHSVPLTIMPLTGVHLIECLERQRLIHCLPVI